METSDANQWNFMNALAEKITSGIKDLQDKYMNRLPVWATFLIAALCSTVTGFIVAHFAGK
ncbi:MAG: hypothetical protein Q7T18_05945 [Sedimentisphaerales bacterium]|nr:hypothetical protein [Sedimentisphaerales bacterium]